MYRYKYMYTHTDIQCTVTEPCSTTQTTDGAAAEAHLSEVTVPPGVGMKMLTVKALTPFQNTSASVTPLSASLADMKAWQFFCQHMVRGNPPLPAAGNRSMEEAKSLMRWFGSMATSQEKDILLPLKTVVSVGSLALISKVDPPVREDMWKFISQRLDVLVCTRLIQCFFDARLPCPPGLLTWCVGGESGSSTDDHLNATTPSTLEKYLKQLGLSTLVPVQDSLLQWRRQHNLSTFRPEEVLQIPDVLTRVNPRWSIQQSGVNKKMLIWVFVLERIEREFRDMS